MKSRFIRKISFVIAVALILQLTVGMMPVNADNVDTLTYFTVGDDENTKYYDILSTPGATSASPPQLDLIDLARKTLEFNERAVIKDVWVPILSEVLQKNGAYNTRTQLNPTCFNDLFVQHNLSSNAKVDGDQFLADIGNNSLEYASDIEQVKSIMKQRLKDTSGSIYKTLSEDKGQFDHISFDLKNKKINDINSKDMLVLPFAQHLRLSGSGARCCPLVYNTFAIVFYDFALTPLPAVTTPADEFKNEENPFEAAATDASTGVKYKETTPTATGKQSIYKNESGKTATIGYSITEGISESCTNSVSTSEEYSFGQSASVTIGESVLAGNVTTKAEFTASLNFNQVFSTTKTESKTSESSQSTTRQLTTELPSSTFITTSSTESSLSVTIPYTTPVAVTYKVAVVASSGEYYKTMPYLKVDPKQGGVYTILGDKSGDALGDVRKYRENSQNDPNKLRWNNINFGSSADAMIGGTPASKMGGIINIDQKAISTIVSDYTPLLPLNSVEVWSDKDHPAVTEYELNLKDPKAVNKKIDLSKIKLSGLNKLGHDYYGFDGKSGSWELCDENGNSVETSDYVKLIPATKAQGQQVEAVAEGTVYLKFKISENKYPIDIKNPEFGFIDNIDDTAFITVQVVDSAANALDGEELKVIDDKEISAPLGETNVDGTVQYSAELDLNEIGVDVHVYDEDKTLLKFETPYIWQCAEEYPQDEFEVTPEGKIVAHKVGTYKVQAKYEEMLSNAIEIKILEAPIVTRYQVSGTGKKQNLTIIDGNPIELDISTVLDQVEISEKNQYGEYSNLDRENYEKLNWIVEDQAGEKRAVPTSGEEFLLFEPGTYYLYGMNSDYVKSEVIVISVATNGYKQESTDQDEQKLPESEQSQESEVDNPTTE